MERARQGLKYEPLISANKEEGTKTQYGTQVH